MRFLDCSHGIKTSLLFFMFFVFLFSMLARKERGEPVGMLNSMAKPDGGQREAGGG